METFAGRDTLLIRLFAIEARRVKSINRPTSPAMSQHLKLIIDQVLFKPPWLEGPGVLPSTHSNYMYAAREVHTLQQPADGLFPSHYLTIGGLILIPGSKSALTQQGKHSA